MGKILVIGDSCKDVHIYGKCERMCPDAPVPGSFVHRDLVESANYCSVICPDLPAGRTPGRCRCRASESVFGVGTTSQSRLPGFFERTIEKNIESIRSTYNEHLLLKGIQCLLKMVRLIRKQTF